jgi:hypothetical protein
VPDTASGNRSAQHGHDMILDQEIGEAFGAVSAGESDGHEGYLAIGYWLLADEDAEVRSLEEWPMAHSQ